MGAVGANLSILVFQRTIEGATANGIPYWVYVAFWIGAVCSIGSVLVSVLSTKEIPPTDEELAELRAKANLENSARFLKSGCRDREKCP